VLEKSVGNADDDASEIRTTQDCSASRPRMGIWDGKTGPEQYNSGESELKKEIPVWTKPLAKWPLRLGRLIHPFVCGKIRVDSNSQARFETCSRRHTNWLTIWDATFKKLAFC